MKKIIIFIVSSFYWAATLAQQGFKIQERPNQNQVDIRFNNKLLTAYCYYDSIKKPILFPVNTLDGVTVTRGFPIAPRPGERTDHPHHDGIWLNYESVNGLDFWNNSTAIAPEKRNMYGTIYHQRIIGKRSGRHQASLAVSAVWVTPDKRTLLNEVTTFFFSVEGDNFIIDRRTTLTATDTTVYFRDTKDGMFAIRVARELELPSKEKTSFVDDKGNVTTIAASGNEVTGMYHSSSGLQGDSVWGSKGPWAILTGKREGKNITIAMIDHPLNVGFPTYWHARGYGLFAANPLGRKIFSNGTEELGFKLKPGQSTTFRYRIIIHSGDFLSKQQMDGEAAAFAKFK